MNGKMYQNTGARASAYAPTMPSRTASGSVLSVCGSIVAVDAAASDAFAPASVNTVIRLSASRVVKMVPKTAVPSDAPTSRK